MLASFLNLLKANTISLILVIQPENDTLLLTKATLTTYQTFVVYEQRRKYEVFNHAHSSLRNVIDRSFGFLKNKWHILRDVPSFLLHTQAKIICACMALHNFIRDSQLRDKEFDKCDANENYIPGSVQVPGSGGDSITGAPDEFNINSFHEEIANSLFSARR